MFIGQESSASSMRARCHAAGRHGGGLAAFGGAGAARDDRGDAAAERLLHDLRTDEVDVAVDGARGHDAAVSRDDLGRRPDHQIGMHARHDVGVARLADRDDPAVANTDVGLDDSPVVDDHHTGDDGVGCAVGAGGAGLAHRLAQHLAATEHRLVACQARSAAAVLGDLDEQVGVGQPDPVTGGRAEQCGITGAGQLGHDASNFPGGFRLSPYTSRVPLNGTSETCLRHTWFEPHRGACRDVEPMAVGGRAVEVERRVRLREVHVAADLDGPVAGVDHIQLQPRRTRIDLDVPVAVDDFAGNHVRPPHAHEIGWWTVTSLVPSGKVASTWTS